MAHRTAQLTHACIHTPHTQHSTQIHTHTCIHTETNTPYTHTKPCIQMHTAHTQSTAHSHTHAFTPTHPKHSTQMHTYTQRHTHAYTLRIFTCTQINCSAKIHVDKED